MQQSNGFTMILGGVDRSAEFRRKSGTGHRSTVALLVVITLLMATTAWLASIVFTQPLSAVKTPTAATARPPDQTTVSDNVEVHRRELFEQRRQRFADANAGLPQTGMSSEKAVVAPK